LQEALARAEQNVVEGETQIARQRQTIAELDRDRNDAELARELLKQLEKYAGDTNRSA
jgi:hypothetical protein